MEVIVGIGIKNIIFGMTKTEIESLLGKPDKVFKEAVEDWTTYEYFDEKIRLIFSQEEGERLVGIEIHLQDIFLFEENIFNTTKEEIRRFLNSYGYNQIEYEDYESFEELECEEIQVWFEFEFNKLTSIDFGPLFDENDKIVWAKKE